MNPVLLEQGSLRCLGVKKRCGLQELGTVIPQAAGEVDRGLGAAGLKPHDDLVVHYVFREGAFDLNIGRPSTDDVPGGLEEFSLPTGKAASMLHVGSYRGLHESYGTLRDWIETQGGNASDESWEIYHHLDDPSDESTYRTTLGIKLA